MEHRCPSVFGGSPHLSLADRRGSVHCRGAPPPPRQDLVHNSVDDHQKLWTTRANSRRVRLLSYPWCNMISVSDDSGPPRGGKLNATPDSNPVGRVLGTADATPLQFWTAVTPGSYLQLDDVVVTTRDLPDREPVTIAGVVTQVRARHEGAQFDSDVFAIADGTLPAVVQEAAEITTTRVDPELYVPPQPGAIVHRAEGERRDAA